MPTLILSPIIQPKMPDDVAGKKALKTFLQGFAIWQKAQKPLAPKGALAGYAIEKFMLAVHLAGRGALHHMSASSLSASRSTRPDRGFGNIEPTATIPTTSGAARPTVSTITR